MKLLSPAFAHGEKIPQKYTCDGENISPPLTITGVPGHARSLVLLMDDPDIPESVRMTKKITSWDHWVVIDIPTSTASIPEGTNPEGVVGRNTQGENAYTGPWPSDREHRYVFRLYALDRKLDLWEGVSKKEVEDAMVGRILQDAQLIGRYDRKR
ncbi:MAG: YbhB/YbcL family Raf kinase inhibitor-like protein [archaeon]|nr:YbhB/YbcL family Raf kinase inhibitor-like protein [archaeon]